MGAIARISWLQAVQKAAGDVTNAQKTLQSGGQYVTTPTPTPAAPPALNINIPGLGGNTAPAGVSYTPGGSQAAQVSFYLHPHLPKVSIEWNICQKVLSSRMEILLLLGPSCTTTLLRSSLKGRECALYPLHSNHLQVGHCGYSAVFPLISHSWLKTAVQVQTTQTMSAPTTYSSAQSSTTPSNALGALGGALEALGRRHLA